VARVTRIVLPGLLLLGLYYALFGGRVSLFELRAAERERAEVRMELQRLQAENDSLRMYADSLEHDDRTLERVAREVHGLVREGEVLYRIDDSGAPVTDTTEMGRRRP